MPGATGVVAFKPNGEQMMAYSFINIRDGHPVEVLYYMNDDNYKLKTEGMIWPGGGSVAPKDQKTQVAKMSAGEEVTGIIVIAENQPIEAVEGWIDRWMRWSDG